jgi:hypothetical protein
MSDGLELTINAMQARMIAALRADFPRLQAPNLDRYPTSLDSAALPMLLVWPAEGSWYLKGDGYAQDERMMMLTGYVAPLGQDDIPSRAVASIRLLEAVRSLWLTRASIQLIDPDSNAGGYQATVESSFGNGHSDGGIVSGPTFAGARYEGFVLRVKARIQWVVAQ